MALSSSWQTVCPALEKYKRESSYRKLHSRKTERGSKNTTKETIVLEDLKR